ncbi:glutamate 5-kinase [Jaminaea rosea]|uniref:Glutamate 5-kinase n=1 Tax=Jaminaea rosea TaxID=1569628 RepID=A0A316UT74_9BASI|nr:glutamate 5-kinase [Jaminaea rosea]PWN28472.1 glutamate 5-kinase [Jaminaea rosea]
MVTPNAASSSTAAASASAHIAAAQQAHSGPSSSTKPLTIVIKLGTSSVLSLDTLTPKLSLLSSIVETCHSLRLQGHRVVIVCSGAIGIGRMRMGIREKPKGVGERQALAALGQLRLMALWDNLFHQVGIDVAQVLLTRNDIADRPRYLNARTTLQTLLTTYHSIPIVNENDTVSTSELRFGDNDTLSAITAGLVDADYLFLCTDVDGLYTGNPRSDPNARRLGVVRSVQEARRAVSVDTMGSDFGTGGMQTKLIAAELATAAGVATVIVNSQRPEDVADIVAKGIPVMTEEREGDKSSSQGANGHPDSLASSVASLLPPETASLVGHPPLTAPNHTLFLPTPSPLPSRKWSLLHALHPSGSIVIDEGAYRRLSKHESGGRLLPAGVVGIKGHWERMQAVRLVVRRAKASEGEQGQGHSGSSLLKQAAQKLSLADGGPEKPSSLSSTTPSAMPTPPIVDDLTHPSAPSSTAATAPAAAPPLPRAVSSQGIEGGDEDGWTYTEVGRCLANYTSLETDAIRGHKSGEIATILGHADSDYVTDQVALSVVMNAQ